MVTRVLSVHAAYACRHSGACCCAEWRIPVDETRRLTLERAASSGQLPREAASTESRDGTTVLRLAEDGRCTAFERAAGDRLAMCAIHRVLGPAVLPTACRQFPSQSELKLFSLVMIESLMPPVQLTVKS